MDIPRSTEGRSLTGFHSDIVRKGVTYVHYTCVDKTSFLYDLYRRFRRAGDVRLVIKTDVCQRHRWPDHAAVFVAIDDLNTVHRWISSIYNVWAAQLPKATWYGMLYPTSVFPHLRQKD